MWCPRMKRTRFRLPTVCRSMGYDRSRGMFDPLPQSKPMEGRKVDRERGSGRGYRSRPLPLRAVRPHATSTPATPTLAGGGVPPQPGIPTQNFPPKNLAGNSMEAIEAKPDDAVKVGTRLFTVRNPETGAEMTVHTDGRIEGFPPGFTSVVNRYPALRNYAAALAARGSSCE